MDNLLTQLADFNIEGKFLAFVSQGGKVKYLRIAVADDEVEIKLSRATRASLFSSVGQLRP